MSNRDARRRSAFTGRTPGRRRRRGEEGSLGRQLEQMLSVTDSALGYMSLEEMLSELLERIRDGLAADTAAILLLDEDRGVLVARAARGLEEEVRQGVQVPLAARLRRPRRRRAVARS